MFTSRKKAVWRLYRRVNQEKAECILCAKLIGTVDHNTSGLNKHAQRFHKDHLEEAERAHDRDAALASKSPSFLLSLAVATSGIPFSFVENYYFGEFIKSLGGNVVLTGEVVKREIVQAADESKIQVERLLKDKKNLVITFDGWTSKCSDFHVFAAFVMFVNNDFEREIRFIGCRHLNGKATAESISSLLCGILEGVSVPPYQISRAVTDAGTNVLAACRAQKWTHTPCLCHRLSLCFKDVFAGATGHLASAVEKSQKTASTLSRSPIIRDKFRAISIALQMPVKVPKSYSPTRWGGAYLLLKDYISCENVLRSVPELALFVPNPNELTISAQCISLLDELYGTMTIFEGDSSTASSIIPNLVAMEKHLDNHAHVGTQIGKSIKSFYQKRTADLIASVDLQVLCLSDSRFAFHEGILPTATWNVIEKLFIDIHTVSAQLADSSTPSVSDSPPVPKRSRLSALDSLMNPDVNSSAVNVSLKTEMMKYRTGVQLARPTSSSDPLLFWKTHKKEYPLLSSISRNLLAVPSSSAATERLFSSATYLTNNQKRNRMKSATLDAILQVMANSNLLNVNSKMFTQNEESIDDEEDVETERTTDNTSSSLSPADPSNQPGPSSQPCPSSPVNPANQPGPSSQPGARKGETRKGETARRPRKGETRKGETARRPRKGETRKGETARRPRKGETRQGETARRPRKGETRQGETARRPRHGETRKGETARRPRHGETRQGETARRPRKGETRKGETETEPRHGETRKGETETEPRHGETRKGETETEPRHGETEMIMERDETETRKNRDETRARHRDFSKISRRDDTLYNLPASEEFQAMSSLERMTFSLMKMRCAQSKTPEFATFMVFDDYVTFWEMYMTKAAEWLMHCEEFRQLPGHEKLAFFKIVWAVWRRVERNSMSAEVFGQKCYDEKILLISDDVATRLEEFRLDVSDICETGFDKYNRYSKRLDSNVFQSRMMRKNLREYFEGVVRPCLEWKFSPIEISFAISQIVWSYAGRKLLGQTLAAGELFLERISNDLHEYYRRRHIHNYAPRLAGIMTMVTSVLKIQANHEKVMEMAFLFDMFSVVISEPSFFSV
ncbi:unnamed protein product [Caenorhabditis sp. 36 PRJEB53466]|nr:unnamed protein product [Caenorhabditis sp. 36 PRJEB53466]